MACVLCCAAGALHACCAVLLVHHVTRQVCGDASVRKRSMMQAHVAPHAACMSRRALLLRCALCPVARRAYLQQAHRHVLLLPPAMVQQVGGALLQQVAHLQTTTSVSAAGGAARASVCCTCLCVLPSYGAADSKLAHGCTGSQQMRVRQGSLCTARQQVHPPTAPSHCSASRHSHHGRAYSSAAARPRTCKP
jgi:hypothetical protein